MINTQIIKQLQYKVLVLISQYGEITYQKLRKEIGNLQEQELKIFNYSESSTNLFYQVLFPLVDIGIIEYGMNEERKTVFFIPHLEDFRIDLDHKKKMFSLSFSDSEKLKKNGISLLSSLTSIKTYIESMETVSNSLDFSCYYSEYKSSFVALKGEFQQKVGIYKEKDFIFYPSYIIDALGNIHKLKKSEDCFEMSDYAHSYVQSFYNMPLYGYNDAEKTIVFNRKLSIVPLFIIRALCMIDSDVLKSDEIFVGQPVVFHGIDNSIKKELDRIIGVR